MLFLSAGKDKRVMPSTLSSIFHSRDYLIAVSIPAAAAAATAATAVSAAIV